MLAHVFKSAKKKDKPRVEDETCERDTTCKIKTQWVQGVEATPMLSKSSLAACASARCSGHSALALLLVRCCCLLRSFRAGSRAAPLFWQSLS